MATDRYEMGQGGLATTIYDLRGEFAIRNGFEKTLLDMHIAKWQYGVIAMETNIQVDHLSATFAALADPTRRAILSRLASGDADVSELMKPFALHQSTISKHLSVLEHAGLITRKRDAQRRPRTLLAIPLKDISEWIEPFRHLWEQRFVRLDGYLEKMQDKEKKRGRKRQKRDGVGE